MSLTVLSQVQRKLYVVVEFRKERTVEIISSKWVKVENDSFIACWPPGPYFKARQLVQKQPFPNSEWECFEVRIIRATSEYFFAFLWGNFCAVQCTLACNRAFSVANLYDCSVFTPDKYDEARRVLEASQYTSDFSLMDTFESEASASFLPKKRRRTR